MRRVSVEDVYTLCNEKQYFTCGTNRQYERMFDMVRNGDPLPYIAQAIWLCSDDDADIKEITRELMELSE